MVSGMSREGASIPGEQRDSRRQSRLKRPRATDSNKNVSVRDYPERLGRAQSPPYRKSLQPARSNCQRASTALRQYFSR